MTPIQVVMTPIQAFCSKTRLGLKIGLTGSFQVKSNHENDFLNFSIITKYWHMD